MPIDKRLTLGAHSFSTAGGATLTYFVRGKGGRVLVNVAPGWGCASVLYQNSFTFLESSFTFVHLEPRGTRGSSFPDDLALMSSWHMAEDVEALRIYLGLDAIDGLLGHSNGGCIATWYAIRYPSRVRKLVLLDSQLLGPDADAVREPATKAILDARPERDAVDACASYDPGAIESDEAFGQALDSILPLYFAQPARHLESFQKSIFTNTPQVACVRALWRAESQHLEQVKELSTILASALIVVGRDDFICPVAVSQLIEAHIPTARLCIIDDSGHFPWIEEKDRFADILVSFLNLN